jgi:hypothetical protein
MKRIGACVLLLALGGVSCSPPSLFVSPPPPPPPVVPPPPPPPPAVSPDEVNEKNAAEKIKALQAEMEYDLNHRPAPPAEGEPKR